MEGFLMVFVLSVAMFLGCYVAGSVPLAFTFSESKLRFVTVFGAGLLVGTALAVIIPEGVGSIYEAQSDFHSHQAHAHEADHILEKSNVAPVAPQLLGKLPDKPPGIHLPPDKKLPETAVLSGQLSQKPQEKAEPNKQQQNVAENPSDGGGNRQKRDLTLESRKLMAIHEHTGHEKLSETDQDLHDHHDSRQDASSSVVMTSNVDRISRHVNVDIHTLIGLALVMGFVFMLIVDQVGRGRSVRDVEGSVRPRYKITATVGLVVHAAADGIALGAASTTKHTDIQFIVFIAIMLHKAPAAFGLVTFLMHEGLEKYRIRKHLLIFALAAPLLAVITYVGIRQGGSETLSSVKTTGVLMLFSAGTFLYVATVHVLPEIVTRDTEASPSAPGAMGHSHGAAGGFKLNELVALVVGALLPSVLTFGHSH